MDYKKEDTRESIQGRTIDKDLLHTGTKHLEGRYSKHAIRRKGQMRLVGNDFHEMMRYMVYATSAMLVGYTERCDVHSICYT